MKQYKSYEEYQAAIKAGDLRKICYALNGRAVDCFLAVACIIHRKIKTPEIINKLRDLVKSEDSFECCMTVYTSDISTAALHRLGVEEYTGDRWQIRYFIDADFSWIDEETPNIDLE